MDGTGCVDDTECGNPSDIAQFVGMQVLFWLCVCIFFLRQGRFSPLILRLHVTLLPGRANHGSLSVLIYYYQLAAIVVPRGQLASGAGKVVDVETAACYLESVTGMAWLPFECSENASEFGKVCLFAGATTLYKMCFPLLVPSMLLLLLWATSRVFLVVKPVPPFTFSRLLAKTIMVMMMTTATAI